MMLRKPCHNLKDHKSVSYTHLDVYKRQPPAWRPNANGCNGRSTNSTAWAWRRTNGNRCSPSTVSYTHLDVYKRQANYLFGASETSRLWNRVRETEGLSYNVRSSLSVSSFEPSASWTMYAIYAPQNRERLEKAIGEELARVLKDGFSDKEVSDGITALLRCV